MCVCRDGYRVGCFRYGMGNGIGSYFSFFLIYLSFLLLSLFSGILRFVPFFYVFGVDGGKVMLRVKVITNANVHECYLVDEWIFKIDDEGFGDIAV